MSERMVSVESDPETLGRAGRKGEKASGRADDGLLKRDCRSRRCGQDERYALTCRETERDARPSALTRAVATACGGPMMLPA